MSYPIFKVKKPGLLTTVQDLGRTGFQQYGMVVAGAMDPFALQVGNLLVGNRREDAGIEITVIGPQLEVLHEAVIAVCGADLSLTLDGEEAPLWKSFLVKKGQKISFGAPKSGARAYLCVSGGIDVPVVMESKSTYVKSSIGGFQGRALQKGDIIDQIEQNHPLTRVAGRGLIHSEIPEYHTQFKAKVVLGPDSDLFSKEGLRTFLKEEYEVTQQSDRMGYRLTGPAIIHKSEADIISDAIAPGTIQIPADGKPIILLADRQTTGGYTRIATVISVDLPFIAQLVPGNQISFEEVTVEEAQHLYIKNETFLRELRIGAGLI